MTGFSTSRPRWTPERTDALFAALDNSPTYELAASRLGITQKTICARMHHLRHIGDPRALNREHTSTLTIPMPDDFAQRAATSPNKELIPLYGVSKATLAKWRKATGTQRAHGGSRPKPDAGPTAPRPVPDDFAEKAPTMLRVDAIEHYSVTAGVIDRWIRKSGVSFKRLKSFTPPGPAVAVDRNSTRDMSLAGQAADFLRRFGPVYRCDDMGKPTGKPTHWRRGSAILTDDEIMERARFRGWDADAWRKLAA